MSPTSKISASGLTPSGSENPRRSTTTDIRRHPAHGNARQHCTSTPARARIALMFLEFFANLRQAHVPATPREYLDLMRALEDDLAQMSVDEFYRLARALLVKDERNLDRFDVVFAATFKGALSVAAAVEARRLPEQKGRHQGGSKWIGTGGTSPFGAYGDHPEGLRIGQDKGRRGSAVKV